MEYDDSGFETPIVGKRNSERKKGRKRDREESKRKWDL
jgi:hypothetical protein